MPTGVVILNLLSRFSSRGSPSQRDLFVLMSFLAKTLTKTNEVIRMSEQTRELTKLRKSSSRITRASLW